MKSLKIIHRILCVVIGIFGCSNLCSADNENKNDAQILPFSIAIKNISINEGDASMEIALKNNSTRAIVIDTKAFERSRIGINARTLLEKKPDGSEQYNLVLMRPSIPRDESSLKQIATDPKRAFTVPAKKDYVTNVKLVDFFKYYGLNPVKKTTAVFGFKNVILGYADALEDDSLSPITLYADKILIEKADKKK